MRIEESSLVLFDIRKANFVLIVKLVIFYTTTYNKLASLGYASPKLRNYDLITDLLTGVKCRATSVAKNLTQSKTNSRHSYIPLLSALFRPTMTSYRYP